MAGHNRRLEAGTAGVYSASLTPSTARTSAPAARHRSTAGERRERVLEAAVHEFAVYGYHGAKTTAIAARAGISQSYIYALFEDKKTLFLACQDKVREDIRAAFTAAARPAGTAEESLAIMDRGYRRLLANPDVSRCQLQGYAASADPEIRDHMRRGYIEIFEQVRQVTGADDPTATRFIATGMLLNLGLVLGLPDSHGFAFSQDAVAPGAPRASSPALAWLRLYPRPPMTPGPEWRTQLTAMTTSRRLKQQLLDRLVTPSPGAHNGLSVLVNSTDDRAIDPPVFDLSLPRRSLHRRGSRSAWQAGGLARKAGGLARKQGGIHPLAAQDVHRQTRGLCDRKERISWRPMRTAPRSESFPIGSPQLAK